MNVKHMIAAWIDHRIEVIRRRTRFELNKCEARAHILEGYLKAIDHLDEVVKLIRASNNREEARQELDPPLFIYGKTGQCGPGPAPVSTDRFGAGQDFLGIPGADQENRVL